jgi:hypothetical protein
MRRERVVTRRERREKSKRIKKGKKCIVMDADPRKDPLLSAALAKSAPSAYNRVE